MSRETGWASQVPTVIRNRSFGKDSALANAALAAYGALSITSLAGRERHQP
jgi:hypothetical protein